MDSDAALSRLERRLYTQRYLQSVRRRDARTIDGTPGDCLRTAAACALRIRPDTVPHFAMSRVTWYQRMRLHARSINYDWALITPERMDEFNVWGALGSNARMVATGPSPRGDYLHCIVVDRNARYLHDPHPTRAGLAGDVVDYLVLTEPYYPLPYLPELTRGAV